MSSERITDADERTIVRVAYDVSDEAFARVEALLADVALRDPDWNGADFRVERDDYTCVECSDQSAGAALLSRVQTAIQNRSEA